MSRIDDLLGDEPSISLEFSPPRDEEAVAQLESVMDELSVINPTFVSVTYGALGSTRETTRDVVIAWNQKRPFPTMAHLTCVGHTKTEINELLDAYAAGGVHNILALGGDPPAEGTDNNSDFVHAIELVEMINDHPADFSVGVAAHPEKHPRSPSMESDRQHLADKLALADFAITQFFWSADPYARLVDDLAALDCHKPVIPGLMLFINVHSMRRMAAMNNAAVPDWLNERCDVVDGDPVAVRQLGTEVCADLGQELLAMGAPGLHLYTMNRSVAPIAMAERLRGLNR